MQNSVERPLARLNLNEINNSLTEVEKNWPDIEKQLEEAEVDAREYPFTELIRLRMMFAYEYLDYLLSIQEEPFANDEVERMLFINQRVLYGMDLKLIRERKGAIELNAERYYQQRKPLANWYNNHKRYAKRRNNLKLPGQVYVSTLREPQLFLEGNHRSGSIIASWVSIYHGEAPFILSPENAVAYFQPSREIEGFDNLMLKRGRKGLPKYNKSFMTFWKNNIDPKYLLVDAKGLEPLASSV